jgi:hypothetical protein
MILLSATDHIALVLFLVWQIYGAALCHQLHILDAAVSLVYSAVHCSPQNVMLLFYSCCAVRGHY